MPNPYLLPLAMLYVESGKEIKGITRFQKLVFLAENEEETNLGDLFNFEADKYGPFSTELYQALDEFENRDLIEREVRHTRSGNEMYVYSLTDEGRKIAHRHLQNGDEGTKKFFEAANTIKSQHNEEALESLLRYVYQKYPNYTGESELDIDDLGG